ncbi:MAG: M23 family metallopeptidase [Nitrospirota bacterium]|nr:M23 family metallopeptidase [Nitrospirota bacterium]
MRNKTSAKCGVRSADWRGITPVLIVILCLIAALPVIAAPAGKPVVSISPKKPGPGDIAVVTVKGASGPVEGTFLKKHLHFNESKGAYKAIVGIDLNTEPGSYPLVMNLGGKSVSRDVKIWKKRFPLQRLTLREDQVTLSPENEARAEREQKRVAALWPVDSLRMWEGKFIDPLPGHEIGTPFGVRRIINNIPKNSHSGVDLTADEGEPVKAPNDGVVVFVDEQFFSGNSVILDHGQGIYTMFFHLSKIHVRPGQAVMKGDVIAEVGSTGRSTGAHLHWGARVQGAKVDPLQLMKLKVE